MFGAATTSGKSTVRGSPAHDINVDLGRTSTAEGDVVRVETLTRTVTMIRPHGGSHGTAKGHLAPAPPKPVASPRPRAFAKPPVITRLAASPMAAPRGNPPPTPQPSHSPRAYTLSPRIVPNAHQRFIPPQYYQAFQSRPMGSPARTQTVYHFVPHPDSFTPIATSREKPYVYLVTKGEQVGIYANWYEH